MEAAHQKAVGHRLEAERSLLIAQDQQTVQCRTITDLEQQVVEGQKAMTEVLGRQAAAERALLLDSEATKVLIMKEAERQEMEGQRAHERAQKEADRQLAEGAKALMAAMSRIAELEAQAEEGNKVISYVQPTIKLGMVFHLVCVCTCLCMHIHRHLRGYCMLEFCEWLLAMH